MSIESVDTLEAESIESIGSAFSLLLFLIESESVRSGGRELQDATPRETISTR